MQVIQTLPSVPFQTQSVTIRGKVYVLAFRWNTRDAAWYFDISDEAGAAIRSGVKIVLGAYLGRMATVDPFNDGAFVAVNTGNDAADATLDNFGAAVLLKYYTAAELEILQAIAEAEDGAV